MRYVWKCPEYDDPDDYPHSRVETTTREPAPTCDACWDVYPCHGTTMVRDWKEENASVAVQNLKNERG